MFVKMTELTAPKSFNLNDEDGFECEESELTKLIQPIQQFVDEIETIYPAPRIPAALQFSGRPESGKTTVWMNMINNEALWGNKFDRIFVYTGSPKTIDKKKVGLPPERIIEGFDIEHFMHWAFGDPQQLAEEVWGTSDYVSIRVRPEDPDGVAEPQARKKKVKKISKCFIFDDVIADLNLYLPLLMKAVFNRRHNNNSFVFCTQGYNLLDLKLRRVLSGIFVFQTSNETEFETLRKEQFLIPKQATHELLFHIWKTPKMFLYIKMDDPRNIYKPFFRGFDHINILNIDTKLLADGTSPNSLGNVKDLQIRMGLFDTLAEMEVDLHGSNTNLSDDKTKKCSENYTSEGAIKKLDELKRKKRTNDLKIKKRGRPKGSKNKKKLDNPLRAYYDQRRGIAMIPTKHRVRGILTNEVVALMNPANVDYS